MYRTENTIAFTEYRYLPKHGIAAIKLLVFTLVRYSVGDPDPYVVGPPGSGSFSTR